MKRWIAHVDMDAFFAAVEQRDHPELKGQAVIIGGLSERGVVSTASYEARLFGVRSAMPMVEARRRCPQGVFLPCNHRHYAAVSREIRSIMNDFSPLVEPLSLDEAFLDLSGMEWLHPDITELPRQLTKRIYEEVGLTASAGLAPNKFLAKIASDLKKPQGYVLVRHGEEASFLAPLPIRRLWGIGPKSAAKLTQLGIEKIGQLAKLPLAALQTALGPTTGSWLHELALGHDNRPVEPGLEAHSIGNENTFDQDLRSTEEKVEALRQLAQKVGQRLRSRKLGGRTITLKVRFASFTTITRSHTYQQPLAYDEDLFQAARELLEKAPSPEGVRLLGLTAGQLEPLAQQGSLFMEEDQRKEALYQTLDSLRARFGEQALCRGAGPKKTKSTGIEQE